MRAIFVRASRYFEQRKTKAAFKSFFLTVDSDFEERKKHWLGLCGRNGILTRLHIKFNHISEREAIRTQVIAYINIGTEMFNKGKKHRYVDEVLEPIQQIIRDRFTVIGPQLQQAFPNYTREQSDIADDIQEVTSGCISRLCAWLRCCKKIQQERMSLYHQPGINLGDQTSYNTMNGLQDNNDDLMVPRATTVSL